MGNIEKVALLGALALGGCSSHSNKQEHCNQYVSKNTRHLIDEIGCNYSHPGGDYASHYGSHLSEASRQKCNELTRSVEERAMEVCLEVKTNVPVQCTRMEAGLRTSGDIMVYSKFECHAKK